MLDLDGTAALEGCFILVCAQTKRVPKPDGFLHAQLLCRVEAAIAAGLSKGSYEQPSDSRPARKGEALYKLQSPQAEPVNPSSRVKQLQTHFSLSKVSNCLPERIEHVEFNKPKVTIWRT